MKRASNSLRKAFIMVALLMGLTGVGCGGGFELLESECPQIGSLTQPVVHAHSDGRLQMRPSSPGEATALLTRTCDGQTSIQYLKGEDPTATISVDIVWEG